MRRLFDVLEVVGLAAVAVGAGLLSVSAGLIVGGCLMVAYAALKDRDL